MSPKIMIIDGQSEFCRLLTSHVTVRWPDAFVTSYDPTEAGHLRDEFSGAGNDIVLLGNQQGDRDGLAILRQFLKIPGFPDIVYFGDGDRPEAMDIGASAFMERAGFQHTILIDHIERFLRAKNRKVSTESLFVGDPTTGVHPLVKGYRFLDQLSAGEHSAVYLAAKEPEGTQMVLKVLRQVPDVGEGVGVFDRFLEEYEIIAELDHPNIVQIYDLGVSDDHAHIAMEYLPGGDLKQKLVAGVTETQALEFTRQIASALNDMHSAGILHRDLKPGNIMLRKDGNLALIDFGMAKRMQRGADISGKNRIFGTPYYMSPEQGRGIDVDERSDVYALGIIMCEMLAGQKPFIGDDAMTIIFHHSEAPLPVLPPHLRHHQAIIDRLLAKKREDRMQSAAEVLEWL